MNVLDYDHMNDDYNNNNCTVNENNIDTFIPTLILVKPCGLSFFQVNLMVYTLIKPLFNNK